MITLVVSYASDNMQICFIAILDVRPGKRMASNPKILVAFGAVFNIKKVDSDKLIKKLFCIFKSDIIAPI